MSLVIWGAIEATGQSWNPAKNYYSTSLSLATNNTIICKNTQMCISFIALKMLHKNPNC